MAIRNGGIRGSASQKFSSHRPFVPSMLLFVFIAAAALLLYSAYRPAVLHSVGIAKSPVGSSHFHSYVARTLRGLKSDEEPIKSKVAVLFKQAKDQMALANAYAAHARRIKLDVVRQLVNLTDQANAIDEMLLRREIRALQDDSAPVNEEALIMFEKDLKGQIRTIRQLMMDSKEFFENHINVQKLEDTIFAVNDQLIRAKRQGEFSSLIAARSSPKSLHCLAMRLLDERIANEAKYAEDEGEVFALELDDPSLYHYAIFSDNVLGVSVVVNSVVRNAKHPEKHVFHVVTDKMNLWTMKVWFKLRPPNNVSAMDIKSLNDFAFLTPSNVPLLWQRDAGDQLKKPKSCLLLKHLRFYLPEVYPKLHRILLLEDDVVVQKDLGPLFEMDMMGKVHGAVETCVGSFNRYGHYLNFSNPLIRQKFDPNVCTWAYGVNIFDLDAWRKEKCTEEYHYWQNQNEDQALWRLGTLPAGLVTFYKTTKLLDSFWHVNGLGCNPNVSAERIRKAAVIHYNGNMKPWLDVALNQYRDLWTKYVDYGMPFIQMCNFGH